MVYYIQVNELQTIYWTNHFVLLADRALSIQGHRLSLLLLHNFHEMMQNAAWIFGDDVTVGVSDCDALGAGVDGLSKVVLRFLPRL